MVFGTLTEALNVAYEAEERYGLERRAIRMAMVLSPGVFALIAVGSGIAFDALSTSLPFDPARSRRSLGSPRRARCSSRRSS